MLNKKLQERITCLEHQVGLLGRSLGYLLKQIARHSGRIDRRQMEIKALAEVLGYSRIYPAPTISVACTTGFRQVPNPARNKIWIDGIQGHPWPRDFDYLPPLVALTERVMKIESLLKKRKVRKTTKRKR